MKYISSILCLIALVVTAQGQPARLRHWQPGAQGTPIRSYTQQQFIQYSRYVPTAPCRIDSVFFYFVSNQGGSTDIVMNIWECDGGSIGPHLMRQLTDSNVVRITLAPNGQTGYIWRLQKPIVLDAPRPFCVGLRNANPSQPIVMVWDTTMQTPSCSSSDISYFTSGYGFWSPLSQGSQIQNLYFSGYVSYGPNDVRLMGNWLMDVYVTYFNVVGPTQKGFRDVTASAGLGSLSSARSQRIAWGDYDGDGWQDLLMPSRLFRNKGNGTFDDVTTAAGYEGGSTVNLFVDVDNDNDLDIICQPLNKLYVNKNDGSFTKELQFGFEESKSTTTVTAADYDGDKYPDIFVGNWERWDLFAKNPNNPADSTNILSIGYKAHLYKNDRNGMFTEMTNKLYGYEIEQLSQNPYTGAPVTGFRVVYGSGWSDFDNDGDQDLFIGCYRFQPNYLFVNEGNGSFINDAERTKLEGHPKPTNSFAHTIGSDWADFNNDGNMDLLVSNFSHPDWRHIYGDKTALYRNSGPPSYVFEDLQPGAGIFYEETHSDVAWGDYDNDGLQDFYITATYACRHGSLYRQQSDGGFFDATYESGTVTTTSWGVAWVDYDNDGDLDLSVTDGTGFHLYRNDIRNSNRWTELRLKSITGNAFAIGARAVVYAGGRKFTREVTAGKGSGSQNPSVLHFGVGDGVFKIDSLVVRWPSGVRETWKNVPLNVILDVVEGGTLPTSIAEVETPRTVDLYQNYPNPFNPTTSITFDLPQLSYVRLDIYNLSGMKVRTLADREYDTGRYTVSWNGIDDAGNALPGGTYMYMLKTGDRILVKRMVLLK